MQVRVKENPEEFGKCGCGRSPTGKCIGWHGLTTEQLVEAQKRWKETNNAQQPEQFIDGEGI